MDHSDWVSREAGKTLTRLKPSLRAEMMRTDTTGARAAEGALWASFDDRLNAHFPRLFRLLVGLYGWQYDFYYHLEQIMRTAVRAWRDRPDRMKALDKKREAAPQWFQDETMIGGVLYVDLFSENLAGLYDHIGYFKKLGLTYLHLMPLFAVPRENSDGGYAVSDYRAIHPDIGTMEELTELSRILHDEGICLVLDFVMNHTSDEHVWARRAKDGDPEFQAFYHMFDDRAVVDQYQRHLRDIFPGVRRGSFTLDQQTGKWVWTSFNSFQWDLNYANPAVFHAMAEEMLFLANVGVDVLRLDAVAFTWKRMGTDCENLPEAHQLIQAFNALARIAAPCLLFKSEAIVHPDEVLRYIHPDECQLSYNPLLMALLWESLATRDVALLSHAMKNRSRIHKECAWVNYLRCHDDIGWTFDDADAAAVGIDAHAHRRFLNDFYTGRFPGSFAAGMPFQFNPDTGDLRISGTLASLAGLEKAVEEKDPVLVEAAIRRVNLLRSIMISAGGIPLIYLGDEWGMLNDYTFLSDPARASDSRWVHRSRKKWDSRKHVGVLDPEALEWRFFNELVTMIELRKKLPAFKNAGMEVVDTMNPHVFGYVRENGNQKILVLNNFSEFPRHVTQDALNRATSADHFVDHITGRTVENGGGIDLAGHQYAWLECLG